MGGLGIQNLGLMNKALLVKWWWKLFNTDGLWQELFVNKYQKMRGLAEIKPKQGDSQFWYELIKHKTISSHCVDLWLEMGRMWDLGKIGGLEIKHSKIISLGFIICVLSEILNKGLDYVHFIRTLYGDALELWDHKRVVPMWLWLSREMKLNDLCVKMAYIL